MAGLFDPLQFAASPEEARFSLPTDSREPYLSDHQPGGQPLFSTVMGLEALVAAARQMLPSLVPAVLEDVRVLKPYLAMGAGPHMLELRIKRAARSPDASFECSMLSRLGNGTEAHHLHARVTFESPTLPMGPTSISLPTRSHIATQATVYDLFFHGPSFQVIADVEFRDEHMIGRLQHRLPPSHRHRSAGSETAPRLIEFGLQTAGLLELAVSGRMMIPCAIARIKRFLLFDVDHSADILSIARFRDKDRSLIDIDIVDERERLVLRIDRYRTEPLPFPMNHDAAARLRAELRRSERCLISL